jgi:hypothetical protein
MTTRTRYKPEDMLTREQTAEYVGVSLSRIAQHRRAGHIAYAENNPETRHVRYRFADVALLKEWREGRAPRHPVAEARFQERAKALR